jgi:UTP--glucose-1-phosphate uridylyltransferase
MVDSFTVPAVIPAAGHGLRMKALSGERPKELLPVAGRAAITCAFAEALEAGIRRVAVVVRPDKPLIERFLTGQRPASLGDWRYAGPAVDYRKLLTELLFVEQPEAVGVADAVARARRALEAEAVACLMPDNVAVAPCRPIVACLEDYRATGLTSLAAVRVRAAEAHRFANCGGLEVNQRPDGRLAVSRLQAKGPGAFQVGPEGEALRAVGRMVVAPRFFELFQAGGAKLAEGEADDVPIYQALAASEELLASPVEGEVFDIGRPEGYEAAVAALRSRPLG